MGVLDSKPGDLHVLSGSHVKVDGGTDSTHSDTQASQHRARVHDSKLGACKLLRHVDRVYPSS